MAAADEPRTPPTRETGFGEVMEITSGDSFVLLGYARRGEPVPERQITLSGVNAPRPGRGSEEDEPFAWQSREWMRKKIIGQRVQFVITHSMSSSRSYADVTFNGLNLAHELVRAGWASVKKPRDDRPLPPERQALWDLQQQAIGLQAGMHNKNVDPKDNVRKIERRPDAMDFFKRHKGIPLPCVVDRAEDGSRIRVEIVAADGTLNHHSISVNLSGAVSVRTPLPHSVALRQFDNEKKKNPKAQKPVKEAAAPFAIEAKQYTARRLLSRDVHLVLHGVDKTGNFFGSLKFHKGNITHKLLENGLAKHVPWSGAMTGETAQLKACEALAKNRRIGLWAELDEGQAQPTIAGQVFTAKVTQVLSGDTVVVVGPNGEDKRLMFASIRVPRLSNGRRAVQEEPYAMEAREFIRAKFVGQKVKFAGEYTRDKRDYVTPYVDNQNVCEGLLREGLATVTYHRIEDDRAVAYLALCEAEADASARGVKVHAKGSKKDFVVKDCSGRPRRGKSESKEDEAVNSARSHLKALSTKNGVPAVVEYVINSCRFKMYAPKQKVIVSFVLAGIRSPQSKDEEGKEDPIAAQGEQMVNDLCFQKDVRMEVETLDRSNSFIGTVFVGNENLSVLLLRQGLATVNGFSADRSKYKADLYAAEDEAKDNKAGVWVNYDAEAVAAEKAAAKAVRQAALDEKRAANAEAYATAKGEREAAKVARDAAKVKEDTKLTVKITEIADAVTFYVQVIGNTDVGLLEEAFKGWVPPTADPDWKVVEGGIVAGMFADGSWHRVRVDGKAGSGNWNVFFVDFGNGDVLPISDLRPLPADISKIPHLAKACVLAGLLAPRATSEYAEDAMLTFNDQAWNDDGISCKVDLIDREGKLHVTLQAEGEELSVNQILVRDGWCRVDSKADYKLSKLTDKLWEDQEQAKRARINQWEYGDVSTDEEPQEGFQRDDGRPAKKLWN